jgi:hypothetical protein
MKTTTIMESPSPSKRGLVGKRKHGLLALNTILEDGFRLFEGKLDPKSLCVELASYRTKKKIRINPMFAEILRFIAPSRWRKHFELYNHFTDVNPRTLRYYLKQLRTLKWIMKVGYDYQLNPFLEYLLDLDSWFWAVIEYATFKIDLFDLFNLPLMDMARAEPKAKKVTVTFHERNLKPLKPIFRGTVRISLQMEDGQKCETILPVNLHGQPIYGHKEFLEHYCVPLKWQLFDVKRPSYFGSNYKRRHHRGASNKQAEFLHFDKSIGIIYMKDYMSYRWWKKPYERSLRIWNGQGNEYLEFCRFETLQRLFEVRFVEGKRRLDLFNALGLAHKPLSRARCTPHRHFS